MSVMNQVRTHCPQILGATVSKLGQAVTHLVEALCYKPESRDFYSRMVSLEFFIDIIFPIALGLWCQLSL
jgi:hypothetical protein